MESKNDTPNFFDVLIVGAGISGINAAYRLQEQSPSRSYAILEARDALGGTWDLFKYPGIRSDSDMYTFGFEFYPWKERRTMADGPSIVSYLKGAASTFGIDKHIRYRHKLLTANWSTDQQNWTLKIDVSGNQQIFRSRFVMFCTGYYDFNEAMPASIPGIENFKGKVVHPQFWPEDLDYSNKSVVIIGSGATAVTLLPNLAKKAKEVIMLQRSPSYIMSVPQRGAISSWPVNMLPTSWLDKLRRIQFLILPFLFYKFCKTFPDRARRLCKQEAAKRLPKDYPLEPNFEPRYGPWDQRLCASPDGDFYQAIKEGKAEVVTAEVKDVTDRDIQLKGIERVLNPDIIVTATGLKVIMAGGAKIYIDNELVNIPEKHLWKGAMLEDVPNAAISIGYTNASWTLGSDATAQLVTRLLNVMEKDGISQAVAKIDPASKLQDKPFTDFKSTYLVRAKGDLPKAGNIRPWSPRSFYLWDLWEAKFGSITQDMHLSKIST